MARIVRRTSLAVTLALIMGAACAQEADDAAALALPGSAPPAAQAARSWRLFTEATAGRVLERAAGAAGPATSADSARWSLDLQVDVALAPQLRAVLADRLDLDRERRFYGHRAVNTVKEAYLSWQPKGDFIVDAGRINQYSGMAIGYNPTDFLRAGALRSLVSVDPPSIKKNRQGSVMVRGQMVWDGASLTALYSPRLGEAASRSPFSADWGATNPRQRAMLIYSQRLGADLNPQWLLFQEEGASTQFGMNLTRLLNPSTVAYFEWSGGRRQSLRSQALGQPAPTAFRQQVATGLTYTTSDKLSLTLEYAYNGAGLDRTAWNNLPYTNLPGYLRYRELSASAQLMPTRRQLFFYATWQDALAPHLDMAAMVRRNSDDHSRLSWAELRYRLPHDEFALQWQGNSGGPLTEYGALPVRKSWQLLYLHYF